MDMGTAKVMYRLGKPATIDIRVQVQTVTTMARVMTVRWNGNHHGRNMHHSNASAATT